MEIWNPIQHRMTRRSAAHDYGRPGLYHITMHVAEVLGQPFGAVLGDPNAPDGSTDAPRTALTRVGEMVEHELLTAIRAHYPMVTVLDHVVMPDHLHFIIEVHDRIISKNGNVRTLGDVITGFKVGCNRRYWEMMQRTKPAATLTAATVSGGSVVGGVAGSVPDCVGRVSGTVPGCVPSSGTVSGGFCGVSGTVSGGFCGVSGPVFGGFVAGERQPLFAPGYCDVMPVDAAQLATQRAYIAGNPRSRLLRMSNRAWLTVQRGVVTTALTPAALRGYLQRECSPSVATADALAAIEGRLLISAGDKIAGHSGTGSVAGSSVAGHGFVACDTFGNRALLTEHRCLPVVCHRKDAARFGEQKQRCLEEAAQGAVLIGTRIAPKEREIMDESVNRGFATIVIHDNGFADRYHPSADRLDLCAADRLLLVSPWKYQYRGKNEQVTVLFCKAMNCVAQALCRTRDNWWKQYAHGKSVLMSSAHEL